ncbi:hypothetical protein [Desulfopila sp. IMCC35006]|uniref:hypothetical protein n=1 Tax=Desulfopila sp. IMCC35006 TaxID=2569542 RepID=UPI00197AB68E|nr:hypothetical protein [Desulfopila sp. IMCC35006]
MQLRKRIIWLLAILVVVALTIGITAVSIFYQAAFREKSKSLSELISSQISLIESVYRFNKQHESQYPNGAKEATLSQLVDSHNRYEKFSATGEILVAEKRDNKIHFIFGHLQDRIIAPGPVAINFSMDTPMLLAISGQSGTVTGMDYSGERVLAAYGYMPELDCGIVAKINIAEIRSPFINAIALILLIGIVAISLGMLVFFKISNPILEEMANTIGNLQEALFEVKLLSGFLPICASCKKIRDDHGYWNQIESYIESHSEAQFSHGICPDCAEKLYPEIDLYKKE